MSQQYQVIKARFVDDAAPRIRNSKYLISSPIKFTGKTWVYEIVSKSSHQVLGLVKWYGPWRQYCFHPEPDTVFNWLCMDQITHFVEALMQERANSDGRRTE